MALIGIENIAANKWQNAADIPRGFLPAHVMGVEPMTEEYVTVLNAILANIEDDLDTLGFKLESNNTAARRLARQMARYYAAEAVLAGATVGDHRDVEGNQTRLSANDLLMWQRMKDDARDYLNGYVEAELSSRSAVWLVGFKQLRSGCHAKTIHYD